MTTATFEALMKVYGILLREGWDEPEPGGDRPDRGGLSEADAKFLDAFREYTRSGGSSPVPDEVLGLARARTGKTAGAEARPAENLPPTPIDPGESGGGGG